MVRSVKKPHLYIITGLSGAGRSTALNILEDHGFFCLDNLPGEMLDSAVDYAANHPDKARGFALGLDPKDKSLIHDFPKIKKSLTKNFYVKIIFLSAQDDVIAARYASTKRRHPYSIRSTKDIKSSISKERKALSALEDHIDFHIDTSTLSPKDLQKMLENYLGSALPTRRMQVLLTSFGFKYGVPRSLESLVDVRILKNPHYDIKLRKKTGLKRSVRDYIFNAEPAPEFLSHLSAWYSFLIPKYFDEGLNYFRICIGCTGGKHRSVAVTEELGKILKSLKLSYCDVVIIHRDIEK